MRSRQISWVQAFIVFSGAALSAFYAFHAAPYVGSLNDDAAYIMHAMGILKGTYFNLSSSQKTVSQFWPGYPLFLSPWVALLRPHWNALRILSIALTALSGCLMFKIQCAYLSTQRRFFALLLFAFHPLTIKSGANIMSEALFLALVLAYFLLLERQAALPSFKKRMALAVVLAWTILTRPTGMVLCFSTIIAFLPTARWKEGFFIVLSALPFWIAYPLWVAAKTHGGVNYVGLWENSAPVFAAHFIEHGHRSLYFLFCHTLCGLQLPHRGYFIPLSWAIIVFCFIVCGIGSVRAWRRLPDQRILLRAIGIFLVGYVGVHAAYLSVDERYFWPLLPFLLTAFLLGAEPLLNITASRPLKLCLAVLWSAVICDADIHLLKISPMPFPRETFAWAQKNIPQGSLCLGRQAVLYVYTGLRGESSLAIQDPDEFLFNVLNNHYAFAVLLPGTLSMPLSAHPGQNSANEAQMNVEFMARWPRSFIRTYENPAEKTVIFKISETPRFRAAYLLYLNAVDDIAAHRFAQAQLKLDRSVDLFPDMASSWMTYGILDYLRQNSERAKEKLAHALKLNPDNILANEYMARVQALLRHPMEAGAYYDRAIALIAYSGSYAELLPLLTQERNQLSPRSGL